MGIIILDIALLSSFIASSTKSLEIKMKKKEEKENKVTQVKG
jgi:hypothetical protein